MLVLTRRTHQSISVGSDIFVTILAIQGGRVRLGIKAPETHFRPPRRSRKAYQSGALRRAW